MQSLTPLPKIDKPVLEFYEDGDWLRIEAPLRPNRYIPKAVAINILREFGANSFIEKPYIIIK